MANSIRRAIEILKRIEASKEPTKEEADELLALSVALSLRYLTSHGVDSPADRLRILRERFHSIMFDLEEKSGAL